MNKEKELYNILENDGIVPVFQPIVSLKDGSIHGYEALSRIMESKAIKNTEELFVLANKYNKIWELEKLCRKKILKSYAKQTKSQQLGKLFINVSPTVMMDQSFKANFTKKHLEKRGISSTNIVIEITERNCIDNMNYFLQVVDHYSNEGYQIAIDDLGSCYSGLNIISKLSPQYLKIDMELIRDIHKTSSKYAIVKGLVEMAKHLSTNLIAEGIENMEELETLIDLGVDYGQGYFIGKPDINLKALNSKVERILHEKCGNDNVDFGEKEYRILTIEIDNYKAFDSYIEKYGEKKAAHMVQSVKRIIEKSLKNNEISHMINETEYVVVVEKKREDAVIIQIMNAFADATANFYNQEDLKRGFMERQTKKGNVKQIKLCELVVDRVK